MCGSEGARPAVIACARTSALAAARAEIAMAAASSAASACTESLFSMFMLSPSSSGVPALGCRTTSSAASGGTGAFSGTLSA